MKKSEIVTYMDAFMEGFWSCYCTMIDLIDDDDLSQEKAEPSQEIVKEEPEVETSANSSKPKNAQKIDRGKVCALLDAGWKVPKIAGEIHASEASIYNIQKEYREAKGKQAGELK
jgi:hypothetical protein